MGQASSLPLARRAKFAVTDFGLRPKAGWKPAPPEARPDCETAIKPAVIRILSEFPLRRCRPVGVICSAVMPELGHYVDDQNLHALIVAAKREDLGPAGWDVTSALFIDEDAIGEGRIVARQAGVVAGLALLPMIAQAYDDVGRGKVEVDATAVDGSRVEPGDAVSRLSGPLRALLAVERVALNFLGHLSGVATHTAAYADRIAHTRAKVYDTRKTLPGLRGLQKYAVACGGGGTHRMGLHDAVLVKDNHLAGVPPERLTDAVARMIQAARERFPGLSFIMVEVDTLEQLEHVLAARPDLVLLDNMTPETLAEAVERRDRVAPGVELEASGGVTLDSVVAIADSGVDRISVGALTHSSPNLDLGLDFE